MFIIVTNWFVIIIIFIKTLTESSPIKLDLFQQFSKLRHWYFGVLLTWLSAHTKMCFNSRQVFPKTLHSSSNVIWINHKHIRYNTRLNYMTLWLPLRHTLNSKTARSLEVWQKEAAIFHRFQILFIFAFWGRRPAQYRFLNIHWILNVT